MAIEVGDTVYLWCHAYLRLIGRVEEILGQKHVALSDASKIIDDDRGEDVFFAQGIGPKTKTSYLGTVPSVSYLMAVEFAHALPKRKK